MSRKTKLWYWFLFQSNLSTSRAKALLTRWADQGWTLEEVLNAPPRDAARFGLDPREVRDLRPPETLPDVKGIRWDEPSYPEGLRRLSPKLQPALLFVEGPIALLERPVVYIPPAPVADEERAIVREALGLLLGESLLPASVYGSDQASLLMAEMAHAEGDILLFVRAGLDAVDVGEEEHGLVAQERLLFASPLPPSTPPNSKWDAVLGEVETAMADRCLLTTARPSITQFLSDHIDLPAAWLHPASNHAPVLDHVQRIEDVAALLVWMTEAGVEGTSQVVSKDPAPIPSEAARPLGAVPPAEPPPTPEETLRILERGGAVPPALKARLFGDQADGD